MAEISEMYSTPNLDCDHRDPTGKNDHVRVWFEDSFAEPDGTHSIDGVWKCSYRTFKCSKKYSYMFLSVLFAGPCALTWGIFFAMQSCYHIWCVGPCMKSYAMDMSCWKMYWRAFVQCYCDPIYESVGKVFGNITFHHKYEVV